MTLLKLDYDGPIPRDFLYRLRHCTQLWQWPVKSVRYDKTQHGWHVVVAVDQAIAAPLIVAAQAILGSDPKREAFNLSRCQFLHLRSRFWRCRWNVLYERHSRGVKLSA